MDISPYLELVPSPVALVTGAARSIGYEIALGLAQGGCMVWLVDRDVAKLKSTETQFKSTGLNVRARALDVTDPKQIAEAVREIEEVSGVLDILVNNAGVLLETRPENEGIANGLRPSEVSPEIFRRTYEVNVLGPVMMIQGFLPLIRKSRAGRIVNASSLHGSLTERTSPESELLSLNGLAYPASKSALNAVTVSFGLELRDTSIKVNSSCPGWCATEMSKFTGPRTAKQGSIAALRLATLPADGPTCSFFNEAGRLPW